MKKFFVCLRIGLVLAILSGNLNAESLTLNSYYPSPAGNFTTLTATGNAYFNTTSGSVGIGTTAPLSKLDVYGADSPSLTQSAPNDTSAPAGP